MANHDLPAAPFGAAPPSDACLLELARTITREPIMIAIDLVAARQAAHIRLQRFDHNRIALESAIIADDTFEARERRANEDFAHTLRPLVASLNTFASKTGLRFGELASAAAPALDACEP